MYILKREKSDGSFKNWYSWYNNYYNAFCKYQFPELTQYQWGYFAEINLPPGAHFLEVDPIYAISFETEEDMINFLLKWT